MFKGYSTSVNLQLFGVVQENCWRTVTGIPACDISGASEREAQKWGASRWFTAEAWQSLQGAGHHSYEGISAIDRICSNMQELSNIYVRLVSLDCVPPSMQYGDTKFPAYHCCSETIFPALKSQLIISHVLLSKADMEDPLSTPPASPGDCWSLWALPLRLGTTSASAKNPQLLPWMLCCT